jgi:UDP-glucuronate 4-epimerase
MKNILVTGGSGFIGSNLCEKLLQQGQKIINIDNFNDYYDPLVKRNNISKAILNLGYTLIEGDILDTKLLDNIFKSFDIDKVVHLAAIAGVRNSINNPINYVDVDIKGTVNLLEMCRKYNITKFIFASSSSVYGASKLPFKEDDSLTNQVSPYAASKYCGEVFCRTYNILYGMPIICLRFFTVYGPRQRPDMAIYKFTDLIDRDMEITVYGDGSSSMDYTYIDDITDGIVSSLELDCSFEIFNLGSSDPIKITELIKIIEEKLGKKAKIKFSDMQTGDVWHTYADITKSGTVLGYAPKTEISEGIGKFIDWYRNTSPLKISNINPSNQSGQ